MKEIITEGTAIIQVDTADIVSKDLEVFYNPVMKINRDITIAILKSFFSEPICIALPLAGSGVRAIRILKEAPHIVKSILINDANPKAVDLIRNNLTRNNIEENKNVQISEKDACLALEESQGFDYIDIDPFGSPNQFLDTAIRKLSRKGLLAITATDTASLAGTYPSTGKRKYWATSAVTPHKHEAGLRILIRKVMLLGVHHNKVLQPILSYHHKHYYRIFFRCIKSKQQASELIDSLQTYINYEKDFAKPRVDIVPDKKTIWCGPLYSGALHNTEFLKKIQKVSPHKIFEIASQEIDTIASYDIHQIAQKHKLTLPPFDILLSSLQENHEASRSSTNLHAIKTTASFKELINVLKKLQT